MYALVGWRCWSKLHEYSTISELSRFRTDFCKFLAWGSYPSYKRGFHTLSLYHEADFPQQIGISPAWLLPGHLHIFILHKRQGPQETLAKAPWHVLPSLIRLTHPSQVAGVGPCLRRNPRRSPAAWYKKSSECSSPNCRAVSVSLPPLELCVLQYLQRRRLQCCTVVHV